MKYHDPNTQASNPGQLPLSDPKLALLHPELYSSIRWLVELVRNGARYPVKDRGYCRGKIEEHLAYGDSCPAVVVATDPAVVAAYTSELDCVALLTFDDKVVSPYKWSVGTRLMTVNTYAAIEHGVASDLEMGPNQLGRWGNVNPFIADLLTDDLETLARRKADIGEDEWAYTLELGRVRHSSRRTRPRDGKPLWAILPAQ